MITHKQRILIATVTYGNRAKELEKGPLKSHLTHQIDLLIVANGVTQGYRTLLEKLNQKKNLNVIFSENNEGSAGGFHKLITECKNLDYEYFILLDDDNALVGSLNTVSFKKNASFIPRLGRTYIEQALKGKDPTPYLSEKNSFLGFDFKRMIVKKLPTKNNSFNLENFNFPWAPYGGLILSNNVIKSDIMPNKDFFLYCDDTLYTNQISEQFGLYLNNELKIIDIENSWNVSSNGNVISRILKSQEAWRTYYSVRNQVYFDHYRFDSFFIYILNIIGFFIAFILLSIFPCLTNKKKSKLVKVFLMAVKDGLAGKLGNKGFNI